MASTLLRLYRYAKAVGAEAKENFTTEALRAAIVTDARPMLEALRAAKLLDDTRCTMSAETQVNIRRAGQVDLILHAKGALERSFWIEVKVDADEHGDQLANYARFIENAYPQPPRPILLVLGPRRLDATLPWLSWQNIREAIVRSGTTSPYWRDLKEYLEEIGMADSYDEVTTEDEARSLPTARRLMGKATRILLPFAEMAGAIWPGSSWPETEAKVYSAMLSTFLNLGTLAIRNAVDLPANLSAGVYHDPTKNDAWVRLWLWCRPTRIHERNEIFKLVQSREWGEEWFRDDSAWELFGAYQRLITFVSHSDATAWLVAKLEELKAAGAFELLSHLRDDTRR